MGWRLIDTDSFDPFFVTAADDALLQTRFSSHKINTLHLYRRNTPSISIGRSRKIHNDVNVEICNEKHITLIRRTTGGGTIYTDPGCLIYSLIFDTNVINKKEIFSQVCKSIVSMLKNYGLPAEFKPPNDIVIHGKKISGSAQRWKHTIVLIHGTLLVSTDLSIMQQVLKTPPNPRVTTMHYEMKNPPLLSDIKQQLIKAFEQSFNIKFDPGSFTIEETQIINQLLQNRYQKEHWTHAR